MDKIRVAKVEGVRCSTKGNTATGVLHLTAHHLIFKYDAEGVDELWIAYPLISLVTRMPHTLSGVAPLAFRCRTFDHFTLLFDKDTDALDVFESVKELTVVTSVTQLYAYFYKPSPSLPTNEGWGMYTPRDEFTRMGVGSRTKAWRFTDINKDYNFCSTYPAKLVIPAKISDATLQYAVKYRSKSRIPVLAYLHWANLGTLTRSSQPMVGLTNNRSIQDEKLVEAIFQSHLLAESPYATPESRAKSAHARIYGATATNMIIDARPTANAMVMVAKGAGTENMDYYKDCKKAYLGIDNIHVMRDSLNKVFDALREADAAAQAFDGAAPPEHGFVDRQALRKSGWIKHLANLLEGTAMIVQNVHVNASHVLIHCSDGWDRTSQLSALAQICLDPFYRTYRGFQILVEKDWLSFGHKFLDRCGHLSSEKLFVSAPTGDAEGPQAFLASVQNRFGGPAHLKETSPVFHQYLECIRQIQRQNPTRFEYNARYLERVHYHLYSCQFGTFLYNNERERREAGAAEQTVSIWDWLNEPEEKERNLNPDYDKSADDPKGADMGVLMPNTKDVRFWHELYGRTDDDMNGRIMLAEPSVAPIGPIDNAEDDPILSGTAPAASLAQSVPTITGSALPSPALSTSASVPVLPSPPIRQDSFRPYNTSSAFSMRTQSRTPEPASTPTSTSASGSGSGAASPAAVYAAGGSAAVKSMWGAFSSGAGAVFSAAQDAYSGATKELNNRLAVATPSVSPSPSNGELRGRDELPAWGSEWADSGSRSRHASPSPSPAPVPVPASLPTPTFVRATAPRSISAIASNPWATSTPPAVVPASKSVFVPRAQPSLENLSLHDPTPSWRPNPTPLRRESEREEAPLPPPPPPDKDIDIGKPAVVSPIPVPVQSSQASDPLGVGLL